MIWGRVNIFMNSLFFLVQIERSLSNSSCWRDCWSHCVLLSYKHLASLFFITVNVHIVPINICKSHITSGGAGIWLECISFDTRLLFQNDRSDVSIRQKVMRWNEGKREFLSFDTRLLSQNDMNDVSGSKKKLRWNEWKKIIYVIQHAFFVSEW